MPAENVENEATKFLEQYHALEDAKLALGDFVNRGLGMSMSGRQLRVAYLSAKLLAHTDTLINIIQNHFQFRIDQKRFWKWRRTRFFPFDHYSICALGRVCYDAGLMLHYLSEPSLSLVQWNLRRKVLYLHDFSNRSRFLGAMSKIGENADLKDTNNYAEIREDLRREIRCHLDELRIPEDAKYTTGQTVFLDGARGAVREAGWDVNAFEFQQSYLSNFVHSHPVSYMRASEHKVDFSLPSPAQLSAASVAVVSALMVVESSLARCKSFLAVGGDPLADRFNQDGSERLNQD